MLELISNIFISPDVIVNYDELMNIEKKTNDLNVDGEGLGHDTITDVSSLVQKRRCRMPAGQDIYEVGYVIHRDR